MQVVVMNRQAAALASDSAVTAYGSNGEKVFTDVQKLFSLGENHPVGVMLYSRADLCGVPWETIVKSYRNQLGRNQMDHLEDYSQNFFRYITESGCVPRFSQSGSLRRAVFDYCAYIKRLIRKEVEEEIELRNSVSLTTTKAITSRVINEEFQYWKQQPELPMSTSRDYEDARAFAEVQAQDAVKGIFEKLPLTPPLRRKMTLICSMIPVKPRPDQKWGAESGIVFAGYGKAEWFPSLSAWSVQGMYRSILRSERTDQLRIGLDEGSASCSISPFAQTDVVEMFLRGATPAWQTLIDSLLEELICFLPTSFLDGCKEITKELQASLLDRWFRVAKHMNRVARDRLREYEYESYTSSIMDSVSALPKAGLLSLAEMLVRLTAFSREITESLATVGGPITAATITKGDGFEWSPHGCAPGE